MRKKIISWFIALGTAAVLAFGGAVALAPTANAYTTRYHAHDHCMKKGIYYVGYGWGDNKVLTDWWIHYDYNWLEELGGYSDYERFSHYQRNPYSWCAG